MSAALVLGLSMAAAPAASATGEPGEATDRIQICASQGLGAYKIGPTEISGYTEDAEYDTEWFDYTDPTSKTFYVRGQGKAYLSAVRSGSKVTLTGKATYTLKNSKKATYRVTFAKTSKVTAATSASVRK